MSVLVTGGMGFIGASVVKELAMQGEEVVAYDAILREIDLPIRANDRVKIVKGDITNLPHLLEIVEKHDVKGVIHLAAIKNEQVCREFPTEAVRVNIGGTQNILEMGKAKKISRVVMVSTGAVFGAWSDPAVSITENDQPNPKGIYATTKYAAERLVEAYLHSYGLNSAIVRVSWVYGPGIAGPHPEFGSGPIPLLVRKALSSNKVVEETGADFIANFSYVKDVAKGIVLAYLAVHTPSHIFHVGSGQNYTLVDVARAIMRALPGTTITLGPGAGPFDKQAPIRGPLEIRRAREALGFVVSYSLDQGIAELVEWVKACVI